MFKLLSLLFFTILIWQVTLAQNLFPADDSKALDSHFVEIDPAEFVHLEDKNWYYFSTDLATLADAAVKCSELGKYQLVTLDTEAKDNLIQKYLLDTMLYGNQYWTGAQKVGTTWQWSDCSAPFLYTDWDLGEPNYNGTVPGGMFLRNGSWLDESSNIQIRYICEKVATCL